MADPVDGVSAPPLGTLTWRKSVCSARLPAGPVLVRTRVEIAAFVAGTKDGEFDD